MLTLENFKYFERCSARGGMTAERMKHEIVTGGGDRIDDLVSNGNSTERGIPASQALRHRQNVGHDAEIVDGESRAGAAEVLAVREGRVERVTVRTGLRGLGRVEVLEGLSAGDFVLPARAVVEPGARLRPRPAG